MKSTSLCVALSICAACASPTNTQRPPADSTFAGEPVAIWLTTPDGGQLLAPQPSLAFADQSPPTPDTIVVDAAQRFQTMVGFGAAFTDAATYLIHERLSASQRQALLTDLFSTADGIGLSFMRLTIGSSDLSRTRWSYDDMPAGQTDPTLAQFSIRNDQQAMLPVVQQVRQINHDLVIVGSPWSPPGWMKTSGSMIGGSLRPEAYGPLAIYFLRFLQAYDSAGVPVQYITVQNEPRYTPSDYPGMWMPAPDRAAFIGRYLGPLLQQNHVATRVLEWDHNWDMRDEPLLVMTDATAFPFIAGVAWHCYGGDPAAQTAIHDLFPAKEVFLTECSGGTWQGGGFAGALAAMTGALVIDATRNWARGVAFWSLALDPDNGPHLGGCGTCRGVVTIDPATGAVTRNADYYALGHASRFVRQGAVRIQSNSDMGGMKDVAFANPDGSKVLVVLNGGAAERTFTVWSGGHSFSSTLPAGAVATYRWN